MVYLGEVKGAMAINKNRSNITFYNFLSSKKYRVDLVLKSSFPDADSEIRRSSNLLIVPYCVQCSSIAPLEDHLANHTKACWN